MLVLDRNLSRDRACSHLRAWRLFLESLRRKVLAKDDCQFIAYKCNGGLPSFQKGECFPQITNPHSNYSVDVNYRRDLGLMGVDAKGDGVMYLSTRAKDPSYCGTKTVKNF